MEAATIVRDTRESELAKLRAEYVRCLRSSERDPAVFRARVEARRVGMKLDASPEAYATAAIGCQFVHRACNGAGCAACTHRGWHSGARPLVTTG